MKRYLNMTGLKLCLLINFRDISLRPKRILDALGKEI